MRLRGGEGLLGSYGGRKDKSLECSDERSPLTTRKELDLCESVIEWDVKYMVAEEDCSRVAVRDGIDNMRDTRIQRSGTKFGK